MCSELLSDVAAEDSNEVEDTPSISMTTTSTAYSLIEMSHSIFNPVKKLWNSNVDGHMEVGVVLITVGVVNISLFSFYRFVLFWQLLLRYIVL